MEENKRDFKIYKYTNSINGKVYIGKTVQTLKRRAGYNGIGYKGSVVFYNAIRKYGWDNFKGEVIEEGLSAEEAAYREIFWINEYDSTNKRKGYNIQNQVYSKIGWSTREKLKEIGRSHMLGRKLSEETKKKIREHQPDRHGINNPMYGKRLSEEQRKQISEQLTGHAVSEKTREKLHFANLGDKNPRFGKHHSVEFKRKRGKKVVNLDTNEVFYTTVEAAEYYKIKYKKAVSDCCAGKSKTAGGFHWKYLDELDNFDNICYNSIIETHASKEENEKE